MVRPLTGAPMRRLARPPASLVAAALATPELPPGQVTQAAADAPGSLFFAVAEILTGLAQHHGRRPTQS